MTAWLQLRFVQVTHKSINRHKTALQQGYHAKHATNQDLVGSLKYDQAIS